jgi:imidazolonepropionase-like amidohydrolase
MTPSFPARTAEVGGRALASDRRESVLVLSGATLVDGTSRPPVADAVVVVEGGHIRAVGPRGAVTVPQGARVLDLEGKFVIPGLVDAHVHLGRGVLGAPEPPFRLLEDLLRWGITTVFNTHSDMATFARARELGNAEDAAAPRFFGVGRLITAPGGWGAKQGGWQVETPEQARAAVRELAAAGVDAVKIVNDDMSWLTTRPLPVLSPAVLTAAVEESHAHGLRAVVHAPILDAARETLRAGADGLMHGVISDPVDDELVSLLKENRAAYVSTLVFYEACADVAAWAGRERAFDEARVYPKETYDDLRSPGFLTGWHHFWDNTAFARERLPVLRANLMRLAGEGVPVAIGTDTGVPGVMLGVSYHLELQLHVEAGLTAQEVLRAATLEAARFLRQEKDLGSLEAGKRADLLVLDADPLADIGNTRRIDRVVKGGVLFEPVGPAAGRS